jgi:23S rRNA pseudouridine1911/1915/1917 synthase
VKSTSHPSLKSSPRPIPLKSDRVVPSRRPGANPMGRDLAKPSLEEDLLARLLERQRGEQKQGELKRAEEQDQQDSTRKQPSKSSSSKMQSNKHEEYSENEYLVTHEVGAGEDSWRLDRFLKDRYRKRSRESIQRAIEGGSISIKREQSPHLHLGKLKASTQVFAGDQVLVLSERKPEPEVNFNYRILYEDESIFVIEKPANLPVHPAGSYFFNTLLVHLKTQGHQDPLKMEREYFLVHRIDKETSGILVLAKDKESCANLVSQFAERTTKKRYFALVKGVVPEAFEVDAPMLRDERSLIGLKMRVGKSDEPEAQSAYTGFQRLDIAGNFSLVECFPKTGRQHQIRVHLAHAGHPIVGDKLYGIPEEEAVRFYERRNLSAEALAHLILPRHALHSAGLSFDHPRSGQRMEFVTDLPPDLREFFESQRK